MPIAPDFSTHKFSGTVTIFLFSDRAEGIKFRTLSFYLKKGTKYPRNIIVRETVGMMGNVQNIYHEDSSSGLYPKYNVMYCAQNSTRFSYFACLNFLLRLIIRAALKLTSSPNIKKRDFFYLLQ